MKTRYRVLVQEKYSKWVDVYAHSEADMEDEVRTMEEAGEIEWDRGEDFDEWNILESEVEAYFDDGNELTVWKNELEEVK